MLDLQPRLDALAALPQFEGTAVRVKCPKYRRINGRLYDIGDWGECPTCHGAGFTGGKDVGEWLKAAAQVTGKILVLRNDGPGWRCDVLENRIGADEPIYTGWSTGWPSGGFEMEGPSPFEPDPLEAVVAVLEQALEWL